MPGANIEILAHETSPLGTLCLRRRELLSQPGTLVTEITLNHAYLMSSLYTDSERFLARSALDAHAGDQLRVLVGGLGLGYTVYEALQAEKVTRVEVVELLPEVIEWVTNGLVPLSAELQGEQRLVITQGDVYKRLAEQPHDYHDVILIDVDHSPADRLSEESAAFYTAEGLRAAKQHLSPQGVLAVWSCGENPSFATALQSVFSHVRVEPVTYQNDLVDQQCTDWLFFASR